MQINAPKKITWILCSVAIVLGIVLWLCKLGFGFWLLAAAAVVLAVSCAVPGL